MQRIPMRIHTRGIRKFGLPKNLSKIKIQVKQGKYVKKKDAAFRRTSTYNYITCRKIYLGCEIETNCKNNVKNYAAGIPDTLVKNLRIPRFLRIRISRIRIFSKHCSCTTSSKCGLLKTTWEPIDLKIRNTNIIFIFTLDRGYGPAKMISPTIIISDSNG